MRTVNQNYQDASGAGTIEPRFTIRIDFATDFTDPVYILSHTDSAYPLAATIIANTIESGASISQKLDYISSIGSITVNAVDVGTNNVTTLLRSKLNAGKGIRLKRVKVYKGFKGLDWSEYEEIVTQIIGDMSYKDGLYSIKCNDVQRLAKNKKLFPERKTNLTATISDTDTTISCVSTALMDNRLAHGTSYSDAPSSTVGYIKIKSQSGVEIIRFTGVTTTSFTGCTRGVLNTKALRHEVNTSAGESNRIVITSYVYLEMPVPKLIYGVLSGALYGQSAYLPDDYALYIDAEYITSADFTGIGVDLWDSTDDTKGLICRFEGLKNINGKTFLEEHLLPLMGGFMPVYADGSYGLKRRVSIVQGSPYVARLDSSNIVSYSGLEYKTSIYNQIKAKWNWSEVQQDYTRSNHIVYPDSIAIHQETDIKELEFRGLHGSSQTPEAIGRIIDLNADRVVFPQYEQTLEVLPGLEIIENGDVVRVELDTLQDFTGTGTLSREFEVVGTSYDFVTGDVSLSTRCSTGKFTPQQDTAALEALPDALYTGSGGTNITGLAGYLAGALTTNVTMTGASSLLSAIYYHDGDLTINSGVTVTISSNVLLLIKGHLTINGTIDGAGNGIAAVTTSGLYPTLYGRSRAYSGATYALSSTIGVILWAASPRFSGSGKSIPRYTNTYNSALADLVPVTDLRGPPGVSGGDIGQGANPLRASGSVGGDGGAGLQIISRGGSFGASGSINLSGTDGAVPTSYYTIASSGKLYGGAGSGGASGNFYWVIDGALNTIPDVQTYLTANQGATQLPSSPAIIEPYYVGKNTGQPYTYNINKKDYSTGANVVARWFFDSAVTEAADNKQSAYQLGIVAANDSPEADENDFVPAAPTSLSITHDETVLLTMQDGTQIVRAYLSWTPSIDQQVEKYRIYYKKTADSKWIKWGDEPKRSDSETYIGPIEQGVGYDFRVFAVNIFGNESSYLAGSATITGKSNNPGSPTSVTATATIAGIVVAGTAPADKDLKAISIEASADGSTGWAEVSVATTAPSAKWSFTHELAAATVRYYRARSIDTSGLYSAYSTPIVNATAGYVTGTALDATADDITESTTRKWAGETGADVTLDQAVEVGFRDWFDEYKDWTNYLGAGEISIVSVTDSKMGGSVLRVGNNSGNDQAWLIHDKNIPFDPQKLYILKLRIRRTAGTGTVYAGFAGVGADGVTWVNTAGSNVYTSQHYHCANGVSPSTSWTEYTGYTTGYGATLGTGGGGTLTNPGQMHPDVRYIRPLILTHFPTVAGIAEIDAYVIEIGADSTQRAMDDGILTTGYLAVKNSTFGNAGAQLRYNSTGSGYGELYAGDGGSNGIKAYYDGANYTVDIKGSFVQSSTSGKRIEINPSNDNEIHFYGDRGDTTVEELATIGIKTSGSDTVIGYFGTTSSSRVAVKAYSTTTAIAAQSSGDTGVYGGNTSSGYGVYGYSTTGTASYAISSSTSTSPVMETHITGTTHVGLKISNSTLTNVKGHLLLNPSSAANPTHTAEKGTLVLDNNCVLWVNTDGGTTWQKIGSQ